MGLLTVWESVGVTAKASSRMVGIRVILINCFLLVFRFLCLRLLNFGVNVVINIEVGE